MENKWIVAIALVVVFAVGLSAYSALNFMKSEPAVIHDETVQIEGGCSSTYYLGSWEKYSVEIHSDDGLTVKWMDGGAEWANAEDVIHYSETVVTGDTGILKISNPGGIISNPTATVQVKIVRV